MIMHYTSAACGEPPNAAARTLRARGGRAARVASRAAAKARVQSERKASKCVAHNSRSPGMPPPRTCSVEEIGSSCTSITPLSNTLRQHLPPPCSKPFETCRAVSSGSDQGENRTPGQMRPPSLRRAKQRGNGAGTTRAVYALTTRQLSPSTTKHASLSTPRPTSPETATTVSETPLENPDQAVVTIAQGGGS